MQGLKQSNFITLAQCFLSCYQDFIQPLSLEVPLKYFLLEKGMIFSCFTTINKAKHKCVSGTSLILKNSPMEINQMLFPFSYIFLGATCPRRGWRYGLVAPGKGTSTCPSFPPIPECSPKRKRERTDNLLKDYNYSSWD